MLIPLAIHLSRITGKIIVQRWLQPAIPPAKLFDQFAFKSSGSTTAALIYFTHQLTKMLEQNDYVRCLMVDFTKAFDTVDHVILLSKLAQLNLPAFVINWICPFLTGKSQQCKVNGALSDAINIGLSIVQSSGIGPTLYIVIKSDLCALSEWNDIFKYADNIMLLVPEHTDTELEVEFNHIKAWAAAIKLLTFKSEQDKRNGFQAAKDYIFSSTACCW